MKTNLTSIPALAALTVVLAASSSGTALAITWQTIDFPSAQTTHVKGISGNKVVGYYADNSVYHNLHAFIYDGSSYTAFNYPLAAGADGTSFVGIDGNVIIGRYRDPSVASASSIPFTFDGSSYTELPNNPLAPLGVGVFGISGGRIVGSYQPVQGFNQAFIYDGSAYTDLTPPLSTKGSQAFGIDGSNIVGSNEFGGFLYDGTSWTTINDPLGVNGTQPRGISGNHIVGNYFDSSRIPHGFIYDGVTFTTLDNPLGQTYLWGIEGNQVFGAYYPGGFNSDGGHGFIATIPELVVPFPGDANGDKVVDFTDLGILLNSYNQAGTFTTGDFDNSGTVDFNDLGILLNNYNQHAPVLTLAAPVPEPSTLLLAALGAIGIAVFSRRSRVLVCRQTQRC